jgi:exodeoxyribonuclease-3
LKLATWNVNSLKVRLPHVLAWLAQHQPDVFCLQETKTEDKDFPAAALEAAGYRALFYGQKTYNGVALLSRAELNERSDGIAGYADEQKRVIAATLGDVRVICAYVPNGQALDSDKYRYKLEWLHAFHVWLRSELARWPKLAVLGDYNIAPEDRDVHDPKQWEGQVLVSPAERDAFRELLHLGFRDALRMFDPVEPNFTWWDYRAAAFRRNLGLRIDHILLSPALAQACAACYVDVAPRKLERPSDHTPVVAEFS